MVYLHYYKFIYLLTIYCEFCFKSREAEGKFDEENY